MGDTQNCVPAQACISSGRRAFMTTSERRYSHRYGLKVPLVFCSVHSLLTTGHLAESINLSSRGVYFVTRHPVFVGLPVRVLIHMPKRVSGEQAADKVFTGRVSHINSKAGPNGSSGVGVEFFYGETH